MRCLSEYHLPTLVNSPGALNVPQSCLCGACAGSTQLPTCKEEYHQQEYQAYICHMHDH